ncbi:MAG TPA: hypothetical protein VFU58_02230, partial [Candidatus Nitrosotalea sp.]|nr:hypothetical protein [Candidatus Nitrosotalea sp.]
MNTKNKKQKLGWYKNLVYSTILVIIITTGYIVPVSAVDFDAQLSTTAAAAKPSFQFIRTYTIDYPDGQDMKNLLDGKNVSMTFHVDQSDQMKNSLIRNLNSEIVGSLKSAANVSDVDITYYATLYTIGTEAHIDYKITLV